MLIEDLRQKLIHVNENKSVKLKWTRAHVGEIGNESADLLAKNISRTRPTNLPNPFDRMDLVRKIKNQVKWEWQLLWDTRRNKWLYRWKNKVNKNMRVDNFSIYESELLNNFFAGSIPLNKKLHMWKLKDSPYCDVDNNIEETPCHYLFECLEQRSLRKEILDTISGETGQRMLTFKSIWKSDHSLKLLVSELIKRFPP